MGFEEVTASSGVATIVVSCSHKNTTSVDQVDATCVESGFTAGVYCNDCQTYISGHEEIEPTGEHSDADGKWNYDEDGHYCECTCGLVYAAGPHSGGSATCTAKAVCDTCHVEYGSVDASAHGQTQVRNASEATCNQEGYTGDTYCLDCGEMISAGSAISATGEHTDADEDALCDDCGAELPKDEEPEEENPGTGDAGLVWFVMIIACSALAVVYVGKKNTRCKNSV